VRFTHTKNTRGEYNYGLTCLFIPIHRSAVPDDNKLLDWAKISWEQTVQSLRPPLPSEVEALRVGRLTVK